MEDEIELHRILAVERFEKGGEPASAIRRSQRN